MINSKEKNEVSRSRSPFTKRVFIWAENVSGLKMADILTKKSIPVTLFDSGFNNISDSTGEISDDKSRTEMIHGQEVLRINGHFGQYQIQIKKADGSVKTCEAGSIFIHGSAFGENTADLSVPEKLLLSLEELEELARPKGKNEYPDSLGLCLDPWEGLPDRVQAERAFQALLKLCKKRKKKGVYYILFRHLPLWGLNGQALYDDLRQAGIRFFRFGQARPQIAFTEGKVEIDIKDQTCSDQSVSLSLDRLLLIGQPSKQPFTKEIATLIDDRLDTEGFLQKDNIHLFPSNSFRKGIYYLGSSKGEHSEEDLEEEVGAILPELVGPLLSGSIDTQKEIEINKGHCVSCLTCYRVCPHHALDISQGPTPIPVHAACYGCGLCQTLCPGNAIELASRPADEIFTDIESLKPASEKGIALTIIFACSHAGIAAADLAKGRTGQNLPQQISIINVPCACSVSEEMLLSAFLNNADRVLVVGCHQDNCASQRGTEIGKRRVQRVAKYLAAAGNQEDKGLRFLSVAPNESHRLLRILKKIN